MSSHLIKYRAARLKVMIGSPSVTLTLSSFLVILVPPSHGEQLDNVVSITEESLAAMVDISDAFLIAMSLKNADMHIKPGVRTNSLLFVTDEF